MAGHDISGLSNELFLTPGAGDGDLALAPGNPDVLAAPGAVVKAVVPVPEPVKKLQKFPVFLIALVGIAGEAAEKRPEHQAVGHGRQQQIHFRIMKKCADKANSKTGAEDHHVQFIGSIAAHHKITESIAELL